MTIGMTTNGMHPYVQVCPADWKPGGKTMVADAEKAMEYFSQVCLLAVLLCLSDNELAHFGVTMESTCRRTIGGQVH
jgi:C-terminal domain of 1-Cys peroxiredoxin